MVSTIPRSTRRTRSALTIVFAVAACTRDPVPPTKPPPPSRLIDLDQYLEGALDPQDRAQWAWSVADALVEDNRAHLAAVHLERATAQAASMTGVAERTELRERIAKTRARAGSHELAFAIAEKVPGPKARASAQAAVVVGVAESGHPALAETLLAKSTDLDKDARGRAVLGITRAWIAKGDLYKAGAAAEKARKLPVFAEAIGAVAVAYARRRLMTNAGRAAEQIDNPHWRGAAEAVIAEAWTRKKRVRLAKKVAKAIDSPWMRARAYGLMTVVASKRGHRGSARRFFAIATRTVEGINDPILRSSASVELVRTHLSLRRMALAASTAKAITEPSTRGSALLEVLRAQMNAPDRKGAQALLSELTKHPLYADEGRLAVLDGTNDLERAFEIGRTIRARDVRIRGLARYAVRNTRATEVEVLAAATRVIRGAANVDTR